MSSLTILSRLENNINAKLIPLKPMYQQYKQHSSLGFKNKECQNLYPAYNSIFGFKVFEKHWLIQDI